MQTILVCFCCLLSIRRFSRTTSWQLVSFPQITNLRYIFLLCFQRTCSISCFFRLGELLFATSTCYSFLWFFLYFIVIHPQVFTFKLSIRRFSRTTSWYLFLFRKLPICGTYSCSASNGLAFSFSIFLITNI